MSCVLCVQQSGPGATAGDSVPRVGSRANRVQRVCACGPVLHAWRCVTLTQKNSDILRTPWRRARRVAKALRPRSYHRRPRSHNRPAARVFSQVPAHRPRTRLAQQKNPDHEAPPARPLTPQSTHYLLSLNRHPPDVLPLPTQYSHPPDPDSPGTGKAGSGARSKEHPVGPGGL